ncbi:hypothetical protein [Pseudarthrobacter raffinosi]|uniref:hypothetical protein n=1 Tax=Pseudarthrobacter raffinosi TaxID=2953651 RepID=UPI00208F7917|nr:MULTISPECIES: hypothetical protein [unclassified Pseudarthrobacter]MCO4238696.1 hypothetical protein [Pseudarthrobacter sp. MDT3-28]MCO4251806.1 hypothetical protein [Pseudarthrobacter sp. MDT3-9]MCO4261763.1 hypothetical protein [Pseudarthrobacter sp. MDT3-26]
MDVLYPEIAAEWDADLNAEVLTGKLSANAFYPKHTSIEFVDFLGRDADAHPGLNCMLSATAITPTSCSRLNMVEIFFGIITRQCLKRGAFSSVTELGESMER